MFSICENVVLQNPPIIYTHTGYDKIGDHLSPSEEHNVKYRDVVKDEMAPFNINTQARRTKETQNVWKNIFEYDYSSNILNFTYETKILRVSNALRFFSL